MNSDKKSKKTEENKSKYKSSENSSNYEPNEEFKLFQPIIRLLESKINIRVIISFRYNWVSRDDMWDFLQKNFKNKQRLAWEFATSNGDLWFLLSNNVKNLNFIHIFSSEKHNIPDSVNRLLIENKVQDRIKLHYAGGSL